MVDNKITDKVINQVLELYEQGVSPSEIKKNIQKLTGYKKTKSNDIFNKILKVPKVQIN